MESIKHKFIQTDFGQGFSTRNAILQNTPYNPEILFLGTFNPNTEELYNIADFFYGRNWFWPALFNLFEYQNFKFSKQRKFYSPLEPSLKEILDFSTKHKLTFADLIQEVIIKENTDYRLVKNTVFIGEERFDLINDSDLADLNELDQVAWSTESIISYLMKCGSIKSVYLTRKPCEPYLTQWNKILNIDYGREVNFYKIFTPSGQGLKGRPRMKSLIKHWTTTDDHTYNRLENEWLDKENVNLNGFEFNIKI
jgi:hypothetical protein